MKIVELVEMYKKNKMVNLKNILEVEEYVSTPIKRNMCELVLDSCVENIDGVLRIDSLNRYLLFTIAVISVHTNLEFNIEENGTTSIEEYDELNKAGLIEKIIATFESDYEACKVMLDMLTNDRIKNQETLDKKILKFINSISNEIDKLDNKKEILSLLEDFVTK